MVAIFFDNGKLSSLPLSFTFLIATFCLSKVYFLVEYDNVVLHRLSIFRRSIYLPVGVQKTSDDIRANAHVSHFRYKNYRNVLCCIFCDMRINTQIQSKSNEGYATMEFKLHQKLISQMHFSLRHRDK